MRFASEQFKDYFQKRFEGFSDNWCSPVAQATVERMKYRGIRLEGSVRADDAVSRRWERNEADRGLAEALMMMTAAKRSFALVTPTAEGARITFENPDSVAVTYDPITRRRKAGLAVWQDDRFEYAQLHLPNSVLRMRREKFALFGGRSEEHTSELQSRGQLVCRLLLEKKKRPHRRAQGVMLVDGHGGHGSREGTEMEDTRTMDWREMATARMTKLKTQDETHEAQQLDR